MKTNDSMTHTEERIIRKTLQRALNSNLTISVNDDCGGDGEWVVVKSRDLEVVIAAMATTGGDLIRLRFDNGEKWGWLALVYGNEEDVIMDSSENGETLCRVDD